jgi:uncharacterized membrane protein
MDANGDQAEPSTALTADRLASLSDTIFGVAMTLVASTLLPEVEGHKGSTIAMLRDVSGDLLSVVLSFMISARYWLTQQQRLRMSRAITTRQTWLHLVFLFLIVLVPISTSLPNLAGSGANEGSVMVYGGHLALLALVNLLLWIEVHRSVAAHVQIVQSALSVALFAASLAVGAMRPDLAFYIWVAVLIVPPIARALAPRFQRE